MYPYYTATLPNSPGIYKITCVANQKFYIGSAVNLRTRRKCHFGALQRNEHRNPSMQAAFNKYGPDAFLFDVVECVLLPELLLDREQYYFDTLQPFGKRGFNIDRVAGSSIGRTMSQASRDKSRATQLGRPSTRIGWKPTPEQVEHHRESMTGRKQTEEHIRKGAESRIDSKRSPETKERMRLAALGHAPTNVRTFIVTSPDNIEYTAYGLAAFCREHNLNSSILVQVAKGKRKHYKGWTARYPD